MYVINLCHFMNVLLTRSVCVNTSALWTSLGLWLVRGMVKTATSHTGDKPKWLQVQSKRINLHSSTMDLFIELLTKFQLIQLCSFCSAVIS